MSKTVFISRELNSGSPFFNLKKEGFKLYHESLIDINPVEFTQPHTDWFFFYSKNGIQIFFEKAGYNNRKKYAVLGNATADYFKQTTGNSPDFIGQDNAEQIAKDLYEVTALQIVTFIKAKNSISSVENAMSARYKGLLNNALIVYDNNVKGNIETPRCRYICLTSPLNSKAWFEKYPYQGEQVFAIGKTTANAINAIINKRVPYCKKPSEISLFKLLWQSVNQANK